MKQKTKQVKTRKRVLSKLKVDSTWKLKKSLKDSKSDTAWAKAPAKKAKAKPKKAWEGYKRKKAARALASRVRWKAKQKQLKEEGLYGPIFKTAKKAKTSRKKATAKKRKPSFAAKDKHTLRKTALATVNRRVGRPRVGTPEDFKKWEKNRSASTKLRRKQQKIRDRYKD